MWFKSGEIEKYVPKDNKWHSINIDNNNMYVDGKMVLNRIGLGGEPFDGEIFNAKSHGKFLTRKEVKKIYKKEKLWK